MQQAKLRAATQADYAVLAGWVGSQAEADVFAGAAYLVWPLAAESLAQALAMPQRQDWVLRDAAGQTVAFGQHWHRCSGSVHIGRLIVNPARRGQGWGRCLCQALMAQARADSGCRMVTLRVFRHNSVAVALYRSLGFVADEAASSDELLLMAAI